QVAIRRREIEGDIAQRNGGGSIIRQVEFYLLAAELRSRSRDLAFSADLRTRSGNDEIRTILCRRIVNKWDGDGSGAIDEATMTGKRCGADCKFIPIDKIPGAERRPGRQIVGAVGDRRR